MFRLPIRQRNPRIKRRIIQGKTTAKQNENMGITPLYCRISRNDGASGASNSIAKMLSQQEYCSDIINFKSASKSFRNKIPIEDPKKEWAIFKDVHAPIIDRDTRKQEDLKRQMLKLKEKLDSSQNADGKGQFFPVKI